MRTVQAFCAGLFLTVQCLVAQAPAPPSATALYQQLQELNFLGNALYIAAHPDDENTRLIAYLSNELNARTAYLSLTRGDGGQNLIGPELRELLGVLRTQELLAARRIDGGEQFFTRANDFGYSKHPEETLAIWNKEAVLGDVVRIIRQFRPDVIINRFDHRSPGTTHGHHTSSALLSLEAAKIAGSKDAYTNQLESLEPWEPRRVFFNTSWWFYGSQEKFEEADKSRMIELNTGVYYPLFGKSNNEIASLASSQHLCQGFGRMTSRGKESEYVELIHGDMPDGNDLFGGINTSWSRIPGGEAVGEILYQVEKNFDFRNPASHLDQLLQARQRLLELEDGYWKGRKLSELEKLIAGVAGLFMEARATAPIATPGETVQVMVQVLNRSAANISLESVQLSGQPVLRVNTALGENEAYTKEVALKVPETTEYTTPYWLKDRGTLGMYRVDDPQLIGKPESPRAFHADFTLRINGQVLSFRDEVLHRYSKPDLGERYRPFEIVPPATASFEDAVYIFSNGGVQDIPVTIRAHRDNAEGTIRLRHPQGWQVENQEKTFRIAKQGDEQTLLFRVIAPETEDQGVLVPELQIGSATITKSMHLIEYDHIPTQAVLLPAEAKVVRLPLEKNGNKVAYIQGAGDKVPESLEQIGYDVTEVDPETIQAGSLTEYDAVVLGIRAYNVVDALKFKQRYLLDYVEQGGNLIVQYNTASRRGGQPDLQLAPYPLELSRDRVSDETAEVRILAPDHPVMNYPNKINATDFDNWVQERGLYFPGEWSEEFTPILEMNDPGESPKQGALLIAPYGKGNYIYTGLSFFRELPAGVPGAYKLFANLISLQEQSGKTK